MRIAVIGNHLPRPCGIAILTTDLCDVIAVEYEAAARVPGSRFAPFLPRHLEYYSVRSYAPPRSQDGSSRRATEIRPVVAPKSQPGQPRRLGPKHRKVSILELQRASERGRLANLLPIKATRMAASPFGFYRGAVPIMASDLSMLPSSGIYAQLCGDAHVQNLGAFEGPDGRLIFDIDDFDETIRGPWEWDVKRMAVSLVLAGREANNTEKECKTAALTFVESYREAMHQFSRMPMVDLARQEVFRRRHVSPVLLNVLRKAERATPAHNLKQLAAQRNGKWRFRDDKPLRFHVPPATAKQVAAGLRNYFDTLLPERQHWFSHYGVEDVAFRVVGIGSVGVRDYIVLMFGAAKDAPLFMQIKEEVPSAYAQYLPEADAPVNQGQRAARDSAPCRCSRTSSWGGLQ